MSKKAHALRGDLNDHKLFASQTINEHPEELKIIWSWMIEKRGQISTDEALSRLRRWPVIVITKDEDSDLRKRKAIGPEARYDGIELMTNKDANGSIISSFRSLTSLRSVTLRNTRLVD
jgi:hypothetical protein